MVILVREKQDGIHRQASWLSQIIYGADCDQDRTVADQLAWSVAVLLLLAQRFLSLILTEGLGKSLHGAMMNCAFSGVNFDPAEQP
jgi:hypothetical protein